MTGASLLVTGGTVVTMAPDRAVVTDATIAVAGGRIAAIGPYRTLRADYPYAAELDASGCVVVPGMVNAHQHCTVDPLIRSVIPDDIDAQEAIFGWAVPLHGKVSGDDDELSATLTAAESLLRGVTTVLEPGTVAHPGRVAAGLAAAGIRGRVGGWGWDAPDVPYSLPAADALARQEEIVRALPADGLVTGWITLVGHDLVSDELFTGAAELAERLDTTMTWHMSPGPNDAESYLRRTGARPLVHLDRLGVLGPRLLLGHAVWLDDDEVHAVLESGTAVASCPGAYLRLGQGYTRAGRHGELVRRGGRVALGCDAHNAGDAPDVLRAAGLLAGLETDRGAWPLRADEVFALATCAGCRGGRPRRHDRVDRGRQGRRPGRPRHPRPRLGPARRPRGTPGVGRPEPHRPRRARRRAGRGAGPPDHHLDSGALRREAADRSAALLRAAGLQVPRRWPVIPADAPRDAERPRLPPTPTFDRPIERTLW